MRGNSLKARFWALIILSLVIAAAGTYFVTKNQLQSFLIQNERNSLSQIIQLESEKSFNLSRNETLKKDNKHLEFSKRIKSIPNVSQIEILDSSGVVIFSDLNRVGQTESESDIFSKVIDGFTQIKDINLTEGKITFLIPIKSAEGAVRGAVIAEKRILFSNNTIQSFTYVIIVISGAVILFFAFLIYYIFSNAEKNLMEQDRSIVDQSKALEEERQLDEAIMSSVAESLIVINKNGQIMVFNPESERITGYRSHDVEYRSYEKIIQFRNKDGKIIEKNPIKEALKEGKKIQCTIKDGLFIKSGKELIPVSVSVAPILSKQDSIRGIVATIQDISAESELSKVKDEFVYVVAHELGNPIFALDGYLSMLAEKGKGKKCDPQTAEMLSAARGINQQLSNLVNELLEVSRNENNQLAFELAPIDITELTNTAVASSTFKAKGKNIELVFKKKKMPKVTGNEQKIREVLINFIDNAIKYTPDGGKVEISNEVYDGYVNTHIKDNGIGIPKEAQKNLFKKFYRVKNDATKGINGTGLGLFITKQIIEKCGGEVWATSEEGKGSTFSFKLKKA